MSLQKGERIISESDAMVMMEDALDLRSQLTGGSVSSLARRLTTGETLSQQSIEAVRGNGDCLLAPNLPGSIEVKPIKIDNEYVVAWDRKLNYSIGMATAKNRSSVGNLTSSQNSGDGLILNFSGNGNVIVCSHNQKSLLGWIAKALGRN